MARYDDERLESFFARYGKALTTGDLPATPKTAASFVICLLRRCLWSYLDGGFRRSPARPSVRP
jgi:hypothetical protein